MNNTPNNSLNRIEFNFTCYALKLLGHNLYSNPWTAVSEIVANGIDAKANNVYVLVDLFNKKTATIEIIDDGSGMTYDDLCNKYTIIGRNKRMDDPNDKTVLGRKGIGKLAALFLSDKYFLCTKSYEETSAWQVDVSNTKDDDVPSLERCSLFPPVSSEKVWDEITTGTIIKLTNVNLEKIGRERLKALPVILSDYYLSDVINCKIWVCVRQNEYEEICFMPVKKHISFSTMYAIFDNTDKGYKNRIQDGVFLNKPNELPPPLDYRHSTKILEDFNDTEGELVIENINGDSIIANYKMNGWIGIHASLDQSTQRRNDADFNRISYHGNAIRLYVRGKLAVDNLMPYINNTQAFSNYIEGEISFDILDDDRFEDISTSNREGYKKDDPRVKKLVEIVGKIVQRLIGERSDIGTRINNEYNSYMEKLRAEEEEKRRLSEQKLKISEEREKIAVNEKIKAERLVKSERKRMDYIVSVSNVDSNNVLPSMHSIYNLSTNSKKQIAKFKKYLNVIPKNLYSTIETLGEINNQILYISKSISKSNYLVDSEEKDSDLCAYISEYIDRIARKIYGSKIKIFVDDKLEKRLIIKINTVNIVTIIENIIGNSIKSKAKNLYITFKNVDDYYEILFRDDGKGLSEEVANSDDIFLFGYTTTSGAGLGLYYTKKYVEEINGNIQIISDISDGFALKLSWKDGE